MRIYTQDMNYSFSSDRYQHMKFKRCGRSGINLPVLSMGLWHNFGGVDVFNNAQEMVRMAFDAGITHFDLANNYGPPPGSAEINFGKIYKSDLRPHRNELIISTKAGYLMWPGPYGEWGSRKYLIAWNARGPRSLANFLPFTFGKMEAILATNGAAIDIAEDAFGGK